MEIIRKNIHTHTSRCGHALGEDEDYLLKALDAGIECLGFSDHIILPDRSQKGMRGDPSLFGDYISSIRNLEKKYASKIEIKLGFEAEWFDGKYFSYYQNLLKSGVIDYLILGEHCTIKDNEFLWYMDMAKKDKDKALEHYVNNVIDAMKSGLFTYVCHPDLFLIWYRDWNEKTIEATKTLAMESKKLGIPLEVNMGWMNFHCDRDIASVETDHYPYPLFWDEVSKIGCPSVIGIDAHLPDIFLKGNFEKIFDFVKEHDLNLVEPNIK